MKELINVNLMFEQYDFGEDNTGKCVRFIAEWQKCT